MNNLLTTANTGSQDVLKDFFAISTWQSLIAILVFVVIQIGFWIFLKKIKIKFAFRVIVGMLIGLTFGIIIQASIGFPETLNLNLIGLIGSGLTDNELLEKGYNLAQINANKGLYWVYELNIWAQFFKNIFINGVLLLTIPIVFVAIFRITAKPGETGLGRIGAKGIFMLLLNVGVMFTITFFLGLLLKVGNGLDLVSTTGHEGNESVPLPQIIWQYVPSNFMAALSKTVIIPVMVLGALFGMSVNILSKKKPEEMAKIRKGMDTFWDILISVMMTFMKIMPLAVMSMMSVAIISRPIGALASIGKVLGIGYLGVLIALVWLTFLLAIFRIKPFKWWKKGGWKPFVQGFSTQSSNASLPILMSTLADDLKVNERSANTIPPISTTMGLIACAGVQSGLVTSMLWTGVADPTTAIGMNLFTFFIIGLIVTIIASLGIAGVPGTATVVTAGVLGGMGFAGFIDPVLGVIAPLDGLFDMGRTGANVTAGAVVSTIVAKSEGLIESDSEILSANELKRQKLIRSKIDKKQKHTIQMVMLEKKLQKDLSNKTLNKEQKNTIKVKFKQDKLDEIKKYEASIAHEKQLIKHKKRSSK